MVGFAAETDDVLANGRAKLARKGCDLLVVNEVGASKTFGSEDNEAVVLGRGRQRDGGAARPEGARWPTRSGTSSPPGSRRSECPARRT